MTFDLSYLQAILAESIVFKYSSYLLPLILYIVVSKIVNIFSSSDKRRKTSANVTANIVTDVKNNDGYSDEDDEELRPYLPDREHIPYRGISEFLDAKGDRFYKLANDRRSIRKFAKNRPVDFSVIEKCILAAGMH